MMRNFPIVCRLLRYCTIWITERNTGIIVRMTEKSSQTDSKLTKRFQNSPKNPGKLKCRQDGLRSSLNDHKQLE